MDGGGSRFHRITATARAAQAERSLRTPRSCSTWSCSTSDKRFLEVEVDHLNADGDGVARHQRQLITIPFTIPGERVRISVDRLRNDTLTAAVEEVLRPSPHRVTPQCPHFGPPRHLSQAEQLDGDRARSAAGRAAATGCGGCSWQHIAYPEQLRLKAELVTRLVRQRVPDAPAAHPTRAGTAADSPWGYRGKAHFVFETGTTNHSRVMGHYLRGTRRVIAVTACPVHDDRANALAFQFRDALMESGVNASAISIVKGLAVRAGVNTAESMATLVLTREADRGLRAVTRSVMDRSAAPFAVHVNIHPRDDGYLFGRETRRISGPERLREVVAGVSFLISPTAFFQTNVHAAEVLVRLVLDATPKAARVLDLYAGAGLFALPLAAAGSEIVAVEENRTAVADGEASRRLNAIGDKQCRFVPRRVEDALRTLRPSFDVVVLDPPRAGCSVEALTGVFGRLSPPQAIYVSCNPEALARDLREIVRLGYAVTSLQPVDMFPHTAHVETVAILERRRRSGAATARPILRGARMARKRGDRA